ncbi:hypothetical protein M413DRAFT_442536 [Hebeloma cylindrosporum]|uniref:RanBP2-type domain-containing protein n=1 Tax=Hebeloma cylindrosporum TaxID=76867 RepID=A0A0C3CLB6_HEBCY|nr:hypothetical protein M413DRAFT_442536 [Hebeloma cylindrosporum h7]
MSAVRTNANRAAARKHKFSPYARVVSSISKILGLSSAQDESENTLKDETNTQPGPIQSTRSLPSLSSKRDPNTNAPLQSSMSTGRIQPHSPESTANLMSDLSAITGVPITNEVAGRIMNRLAQHDLPGNASVESVPESTFRFTSRQGSPISSSASADTLNASPSTTPRRLPRNPNGSYRWGGGGSAKYQSPNRHRSPALVPPTTPAKTSAKSGEDSLPDSKRRRLGEDGSSSSHAGYSESSSSSHPIPFPVSSPTTPHTNGAAKPNALSSSSRLRTPVKPMKPTAPVVSSPLRQQVWSEASSSSSRDDTKRSPSQQPKQTKTANFMADLIKETTPPARTSHNFNPYDAPVGVPKKKRPRATGQPPQPTHAQRLEEQQRKEEEENQKKTDELKEYSPQAIIEATVPKGSKRSRPPAHFEKPSAVDDSTPTQRETPVVEETKTVAYTVEEVDEDTQRSAKRSKPSVNGHGLPSSVPKEAPSPSPAPEITIEEIADVDMQSAEKEQGKATPNDTPKPMNGNGSSAPAHSPSPASSRSSFGGLKANSIPKEPSKLRFSFQAESASTPPSPTPPVSSQAPQSTPATLPKTDFKFSPASPAFEFSFKADSKAGPSPTASPEQKIKKDDKPVGVDFIKAQVREMDVASLPQYDFTTNTTAVLPNITNHARVREDVKVLPKSTLPTFEFTAPATGFSFNYDPSNPKRVDVPSFHKSKASRTSPPKIPKPFPPGFSSTFAFGASSSSPTPAAPAPAPVPPSKGFDFAAAGMKAPTPKKDTWTCSDCMVTNSLSASKCVACEAPAPQGAPTPSFTPPTVAATPPAVPVKGFDFAAAGMKVPTVSKDAWTCSLCAISNEKSLSKCKACETPVTLFS